MMFVGSPVSSTSPVPPQSPLVQSDTEAPEEGDPSPPSRTPPLPCWATQALCDLARGETELRRLRERQVAEAEAVGRGVERAVLGACREECRLLERVEQDHRDAQRRLEQLQRDNAAAARVAHTLVDQRLHKLAQLREQIRRSGGGEEGGSSGDGGEKWDPLREQLLKGVAEIMQPWEISLSLRRVSFKPSSQPKAISFGEIRVQEHSVSFPLGGCGLQGQLCSLHASGGCCGGQAETAGGEGGRSTPEGAGSGQGQGVTSPTSSGSLRVVRKIRLSARSDEDSAWEEVRLPSPKLRHWPPRPRDPCDRDSSQDEELESPKSEVRGGDDLFLAVPALLSNGESEEGAEDLGYGRNGAPRQYGPRSGGERMQRSPVRASQRQPSPSPERQATRYSRSFDHQELEVEGVRARMESPKGVTQCRYGTQPSPRSPCEPLCNHSCLDLSSPRDRSQRSRVLSIPSDERGPPWELGIRALSPADSVDSGYTFIVSSPRDYATPPRPNPRLSKSAADLSQRSHPPLISGASRGEQLGVWKVNRSHLVSSCTSPGPGQGQRRAGVVGRTLSCPASRNPVLTGPRGYPQRRVPVGQPCHVSRSLSMSVIDSSSQDGAGQHPGRATQSQERGRLRGERSEPVLPELEEEGDREASLAPEEEARLVRQFGKQGSGRADLTLPSGVHATPQGQLFLVDCGNARVQVTDPRGNVLQQVTSPGNDLGGSARRCRNYFDVAVNAKGLIALSCAAERALLVLSRHGRLLQTFGGGPWVGGAPRDELEAPRGVTVTQRDEFLVADIRKGTLTALKLDPKTGSRLERTVVTGFHRPYLVAACQSSGLVAVSERGSETGREPCVKVLESGWNTVRVLGVCSTLGPVLSCPWGLCIDRDGGVLVADWAERHRVVLYPAQGVGRPVVTWGLSSPRGLALLPDGLLVVSDSMHHCIKIYQYK